MNAKRIALAAWAGLVVAARAAEIYPVPACETRNGAGYAVTVDGQAAPVSEVRNSAMPVNIRWPGHQRELDQSEIDGMVRFATEGAATLAVTAPRDFASVLVRPHAKNVKVSVKGRTATFTIPGPGHYSVEFDGCHRNLHVFADPPVDCKPDEKAPGVIYFGPGEHNPGLITLKTGDTLYLDEGAVVFGRVVARDADDIRICGRGILDMSRIKEQPVAIDPKLAAEQKAKGFAITNARRWDAVRIEFCDNVLVDGITIRDSLCYNIRPIACRNLEISNVKICGNWRYNSDGIDMHNCENVRIRDCFVRTFDDAICVKGFDYCMDEKDMLHDGYLHSVFTNVVVEGCTVWCDWGRSLEFGAETRAEVIRDVTWRNCDLIHNSSVACELQNCDYADIHDVLFEDIRVELDYVPDASAYSASAKDFNPKARGGHAALFGSTIHVIAEYSKDGARRGRNRDVTLRNIRVTGDELPRVFVNGYDAEHRTTGIVMDGVYLNGREISTELRSAQQVGKFADPIAFPRADGRQTVDLRGEWRFRRDDAAKATVATVAAKGTKFVSVDVPHDWAAAGPFKPDGDGETAKLPWRGVGWYRRMLPLGPLGLETTFRDGFRAYLEFDGVMCRSEVYANGVKLGDWDYGYTSFRVDATEQVKASLAAKRPIELVVRADTRTLEPRWYPGAGMYRAARLVLLPPAHAKPGATFVTTPTANAAEGVARVAFEPVGAKTAKAVVKDAAGKVVATAEGASPLTLRVAKPALWNTWDAGGPNLYTLELRVGTDVERVRFGFREFAFEPDDGFHLNGRRVQLKGVNLHHDLGPLGAAFNRSAAKRQLVLMTEAGANALRTSHNPPAPEVLDLCDELGIFVWDECFDKWDRTAGKTAQDELEPFVAKHLRAMVERDRNHPCVFVWSIGNEIWNDGGLDFQKKLRFDGMSAARNGRFHQVVRALDTTRPTACGCCYFENVENGALEALDLTGFNYGHWYGVMKQRRPKCRALCSESAAVCSDTDAYHFPLPRHTHDFSAEGPWLSASGHDHLSGCGDVPDMEFNRLETDRFAAGEFIWTGFDYLGEPWPWGRDNPLVHKLGLPESRLARSASYGICDLAGGKKDRFWLYRSHWNPAAPTVHLLPHWTWPGREGELTPVYGYANGDEAELFLNGRSLGRRVKKTNACKELEYYPLSNRLRKEADKDGKPFADFTANPYLAILDKYRFRWNDVRYAPGELKMVAYRGGRKIGETVRRTAGKACALAVEPEAKELPRDPDELVFVKVQARDAAGVHDPRAAQRVTFQAAGAVEIVALCCSDACCFESFVKTTDHALVRGTAWAVIRRRRFVRSGTGSLTVSAPGLGTATVRF